METVHTIGIVGNGVVGSALASAYSRSDLDITVKVHDINPARSDHILSEILEADLIFVCLPTPQKHHSYECDLNYVETFFSSPAVQSYPNLRYVLKSTVPIGTTDRLSKTYSIPHLIHSPEFLTARTAKEDAANPKRMIIGFQENGQPLTNSHPSFTTVTALQELYDHAHESGCIHLLPNTESEAVKLFQNAFSAIKISAFNEFYSLSESMGLCWERIRRVLLAGGWINRHHTQVPGPDGQYGYGGTCLPKDIASLTYQIVANGQRATMCGASIARNKSDREHKS